MFFCCQTPEKGDYALQMFQTPRQLSAISHEKSLMLKGFGPHQKTKVVGLMSKNDKKAPVQLDQVLNHIKATNADEDFSLKKVLKSDYERLLEQYAKGNKNWTDPDFPPDQKSFGLGKKTEKVVWKRLGEIIKNPVFVADNIAPEDILQGKIGDCYFLSAIAGLAEKESRVTKIFPNLEINKNGIYMVRVLQKGVLREVVVDDYFPCSRKDGSLMCCQPSNGVQAWVMILEKCWAKLFGSYESIESGLPNEVLHAFSAAPIYQYLTSTEEPELDRLFASLVEAEARNWVMCCGTYPREDIEEVGLVEGHAYTILSAFQKPRRMLKIRNPWGEREWQGRAADKDTKFWNSLSPADKKHLGYGVKDDGIFFMIWQEFLQFFQLVDICRVDDKANYYYEELTYPCDQPLYVNLVTKGGKATIALTQENTRGKQVPQPRYASATIIVSQKKRIANHEEYIYIQTISANNQCDINLELDFEPGEYVLYSALQGNPPIIEATLSCYSGTAVQLLPLAQLNTEQFMHSLFLDHARNNKENQQRIFGNIDVWVCMEIIYDCGIGYTVVHIGPNVKTKISLTFNEDEYQDNHFELLPPFKGSGSFKIVCEPGQDSIVLCRIIPSVYAIEASMPVPNIRRLS